MDMYVMPIKNFGRWQKFCLWLAGIDPERIHCINGLRHWPTEVENELRSNPYAQISVHNVTVKPIKKGCDNKIPQP